MKISYFLLKNLWFYIEKKSTLMVLDKSDNSNITLLDWFEASHNYLKEKIKKYCISNDIDPKEDYISDLPMIKKALKKYRIERLNLYLTYKKLFEEKKYKGVD